MSFAVGQSPSSAGRKGSNRKVVGKVDVANGGLKKLPPEDGGRLLDREDTWESTDSQPSSSRKSSSGYRPPPVHRSDSGTPRRTPTPSKQVHLQAARKKDNNDGISYGELDWEEHNKLEQERLGNKQTKQKSQPNHSINKSWQKSRAYQENGGGERNAGYSNREPEHKRHNCDSSSRSPRQDADNSAEQMLKMCYKKENVSDLMDEMGFSNSSSSSKNVSGNDASESSNRETSEVVPRKKSGKSRKEKSTVHKTGSSDIEDSDQFDTDLEDAEEKSSSDSGEEEKSKAPNELLMEFLGTVMEQDWSNAQKLCKMILLYEPDNPEAKNFQGLIEEKVQLETELANESSSEYDSDEEDDDDEDDDDEESSDEDTDEESDESEEEDEQNNQKSNPGVIAEANMRY